MTGASTVLPSLTFAVISSHYLLWLGLQSILAGAGTVTHLHPRMMPDALRTEQHPDVFVLDLETNRDSIDTIRQIRESAPTSKILLLSGVEDKQCLHEAFASGADGVILKVQPSAVVLAMIEALYAPVNNRGHAERRDAVSVDLGKMSQQKLDLETQLPAWSDSVTERERDVIQLVRQGLSNKEIANRLCIADSTVRHHLTNIFDKLGVANRQKLLIHAHRVPSIQI